MVERVNTAYHSPRNKILLNWAAGVFSPGGGSSNPFDLIANNPNTNGPAGGPYPPEWRTCRAGIDGNCTIALRAGFTAPVDLIAWEWNGQTREWFKLGAAAALYQTTYDATYAQSTFLVSENAYILIQSNNAITQFALTDGTIDNKYIGGAQEG